MTEIKEMTYNRAKEWQIGLFTMNNAATNTALFLIQNYEKTESRNHLEVYTVKKVIRNEVTV